MRNLNMLEYSYWWSAWIACGICVLLFAVVAIARRRLHILSYSFLAIIDAVALSVFGRMMVGVPSLTHVLILAGVLLVGNLVFLTLLQKGKIVLNASLVQILNRTEAGNKADHKNLSLRDKDFMNKGFKDNLNHNDEGMEGVKLAKIQQEELILKKADELLSRGDYDQASNLLELLCIQTESEWCKRLAYERLLFLKGKEGNEIQTR